MANARAIVEKFQAALGTGDWTAARQCLHDNLSFRGPLEAFEKADPYIEAIKKLHPIVERIDLKKLFVDGNDVCMLYDMVTKTPAGTAFIAEWLQVMYLRQSRRLDL